jgi:hypothetical protein
MKGLPSTRTQIQVSILTVNLSLAIAPVTFSMFTISLSESVAFDVIVYRTLSPTLEASFQSVEPSINTSHAPHRRPSSSPSPILQAFTGQPTFRSMSRSSSFNVERELEEREMLRKQRMRKAGGNVDCGTVTVLFSVMVVCLTVMLLVYLKIR